MMRMEIVDRRPAFARCHGFTFVEVLLVIVIAAAGAALVGGALFKAYDTVRLEAEEAKVVEIMQNVSWRTFLRHEPCTIIMKDKGIKVCGEDDVQLNYIDFGEKGSAIVFDVNGFQDTNLLIYRRNGRGAEIDLEQVLAHGFPPGRTAH